MTEARSHGLGKLYSTARWRRIRLHQLSLEPLCRLCAARNRIVAATICDHITPHRGDLAAFWQGPFQSLCKTCHDGTKQEMEKSGHLRGCDEHGTPLAGW